MQLVDFRTAVGRRAGVPASDDLLDDEINGALFEIAQKVSWPWLTLVETISIDGAGDGTIADGTIGSGVAGDPLSSGSLDAWLVPADFRQALSVVHDGEPLRYVVPADADVLRYPTGWWIDYEAPISLVLLNGDNLEGAVALRYMAHETVLVADGDTPKIPPPYDDVVVLLAAASLLEGRHDEQKRADRLRARAEIRIFDMRKHADPSKAGSYHHRVSRGVPF